MSSLNLSWVKKLAASAIAVTMLAVPLVQAATFGFPPEITSSSATPNPFNPDNGPLAITWTLGSEPGNIEVDILNSSFVKVRDLIGLTPYYNVQLPVYWDGQINGQDAPAGVYYYYITASNGNGSDVASGPVTLQYSGGNPGTAPVIGSSSSNDSSDYASPNPFDPNTQSTTVFYTLNTASTVTVSFKNGSNQVVETVNGSQTQAVWDGKNSSNQPFPEGIYTYTITATANGQTDTEDGTVEIEYVSNPGTAPVIGGSSSNDSDDYASPNPFDPNVESTTVHYTLNTSSTVTVAIKNGSNQVVETVNGSQTQAVWDGKNSSNQPFPEGTYSYTITATANGQTDTEDGTVEIQYGNGGGNDVPQIGNSSSNDTNDYASPNPFDPHTESTTIHYSITDADSVTVKIYDGGNLIETLSNPTMSQAVWDGEDSNSNAFPEDTYTYTITATNENGSDTEDGTVTIEYDGGSNGDAPNITSHDADPNPFDPDQENTKITFRTDEDADVTVEIYDGSEKIRTLLDGVEKDGNVMNSVSWNGEDKFGDQVNDDTYTYKIKACDVNDSTACDNESGSIRVDTDGSDDDDNGDDDLISNVEVNNAVFDPTENEEAEVCFDIENDNTEITVEVLDGDNDVVRELVDGVEYDRMDNRCFEWDGEDDDGDVVDDEVYRFRVRAELGNETEVETAYTEVDTDGHIIGFPGSDDSEFCGGFTDVPKNSPFCKAIELMFYRGIFTGYADGTFRPYADINRAEATKVILLALDYDIMSDDGSNLGFWDVVKGSWYMPYLRTARSYGIIHGYPDGAFRPAGTINRVELLKIFLNASDIDIPHCNVQPYPDTPINIETRWYMDYACFAKAYGLMGTDSAGNFHPDQPMNRADVANLFYQFEMRGLYNGYNPNYYNNYYGGYYGTPIYTAGSSTGDLISSIDVEDAVFDPTDSETTRICFDIENDNTEITVDVLDADNDVVRELVDGNEYDESTNRCITWNGRDDDNDIVDDGDYRFRVRADVGNAIETAYQDVEVDSGNSSNGDLITNIDVEDAVFDPTNGETARVCFDIENNNTDITVEVIDEDNDVVRELADNVEYDITINRCFTWNGRNDSSNVVPDGDYEFRIRAEEGSDVQTEYEAVEVNT